ncbi:uncharacterized protein [Parasteatoda tepidariorum]|uniref:uncharacterized protein n=1 Tax=Parasteatoda tepidariorum TaxID=114398 RepID=UPI0039BD6489
MVLESQLKLYETNSTMRVCLLVDLYLAFYLQETTMLLKKGMRCFIHLSKLAAAVVVVYLGRTRASQWAIGDGLGSIPKDETKKLPEVLLICHNPVGTREPKSRRRATLPTPHCHKCPFIEWATFIHSHIRRQQRERERERHPTTRKPITAGSNPALGIKAGFDPAAIGFVVRLKWLELCSKLDSRSSDTKLWKLVKSLNKEQQQREKCNTIVDENGNLAQDDKAAANLLGLFYQDTSTLNFSKENSKVKTKAINVLHGCRTTATRNPIFTSNFNLHELECAMNEANLNKSPGPDGIHGQMLKHLGKKFTRRFLDIINQSWRLGRLPNEWKRAIIIPIRKPNKEASSPDSYRPIALTSTACKIMERMLLNRLIFFLDSHNLLPKEQYGFRTGHSTTDQVLFFGQRIRDAHNHLPTKHTAAVFLDLSKAFDRVWKQKLIVKLFTFFKIDGFALPWINDFLKFRLFNVKFNNVLSDTFTQRQGLPQGSVLSPTLFSLFLAGIERVISKRCEVGLFADDIVLWCSDSEVSNIENHLNLTLMEIQEFAKCNKLTFNHSKSSVSFFTTNKRLYRFQPNILLNGQTLLVEKHPSYLGFILDPELTNNKHINNLVLKSRKRLKILKYIAGRNWGADATTLRATYLALIRPILEYGAPVYSCASASNLQRLERVQLSAARIITGLRNSCPNDIVLFEVDLQPLGSTTYWILSDLVRQLEDKQQQQQQQHKLSSLGHQNRTADYLQRWSSNQRLKKNSPLSQAVVNNVLAGNVEDCLNKQFIDPTEGLTGVYFHQHLSSQVNKKLDHPELLKQLALEVINTIPKQSILVYTDGSKTDTSSSGSGVYIKSSNYSLNISKRNPDFCSVFRSVLIAIDTALDSLLTLQDQNNIWILSDSLSSIQYLTHWRKVRDKTSDSILHKTKILSRLREVHLQWIPSHVGVLGNDIADTLAKEGTKENLISPNSLTFMELASKKKKEDLASWLVPPKHHWYQSTSPGGALNIRCNRKDQTALTRLISGHLKSLSFEGSIKIYPNCPRCHNMQASPQHILDCLGLDKRDILKNTLMVADFLRVMNFMDIV